MNRLTSGLLWTGEEHVGETPADDTMKSSQSTLSLVFQRFAVNSVDFDSGFARGGANDRRHEPGAPYEDVDFVRLSLEYNAFRSDAIDAFAVGVHQVDV